MKGIFVRMLMVVILLLLFSIPPTAFVSSNSKDPILQLSTSDPYSPHRRSNTVSAGVTYRVSVSSEGTEGDGDSGGNGGIDISADGHYIAFYSSSTNLASIDIGDYSYQVYVHDFETDQTELVSVTTSGIAGDGFSAFPSISGDGRYVAFASLAYNLANKPYIGYPGTYDVYVHDRLTGQTEIVSLSYDGEFALGSSSHPSISDDGRFVAFESNAPDLVPNDTNYSSDVFVHDRLSGTTSRVSVASDGTQGDAQSERADISGDGRYVAILGRATNLVDGDTNASPDYFVHDLLTAETSRVSVASDGTEGSYTNNLNVGKPVISYDGRFVAFASHFDNLVPDGGGRGLFIHDNQTHQTTRVSVSTSGEISEGGDDLPAISADGRFVAFRSAATNLVDVPGYYPTSQSAIYLRDRVNNETTLISVALDGTKGNAGLLSNYSQPGISADGRFVVFDSLESNMVVDDTNSRRDVFLRDRCPNGICEARYSISGQVLEQNGTPVSGVQIGSTSSSVQTDSSGNFVMKDLIEGTYTIIPTLAGLRFIPPSRTITVPPSASQQSFTAIPEDSGSPKKLWTVMFYMAADNDLESAITTEYERLSRAAQNPNISITAFFDGKESAARYIAFTTEGVSGPEWKGELNTGHYSTLKDFVTWARVNYPADHYALVISDHGEGLSGVAMDETSGGDWLSPDDLRDALAWTGKVDIISMSNCIMALIDMEFEMQYLADYYVASQSPSWLPRSHDLYLSSIGVNAKAEDLAKSMAESYYQEWHQSNRPSTISVAKLSQVENVARKTVALANSIRKHWEFAPQVWGFTDATVLQRFDENLDFVIDNKDLHADLYHFALLMSSLEEPEIKGAANDLITAIQGYVIYNEPWSGIPDHEDNKNNGRWDHEDAYGVSVALPRDYRLAFYTADWLSFAGYFPSQALSAYAEADVHNQASQFGWSNFLDALITEFNPDAPVMEYPPPLIAPLQVNSFDLYLPLTVNLQP